MLMSWISNVFQMEHPADKVYSQVKAGSVRVQSSPGTIFKHEARTRSPVRASASAQSTLTVSKSRSPPTLNHSLRER